ncbi:uncharacterized protein LOC126830920 isoform X3 [Patella vulgata]|nr:uncharacterized protein LOC126830920 isoform X3 [Patella vulgata]
MYICSASIGSYCTSSDVTNIQIQYPLSLNITVNDTSEAVELICRVVDGYPTNFTMSNWTHYIDGQFVRELEGVVTEDRTALVLNNTKLNEGTYVCNASNGIKDFRGSVYQTDVTYINIEAPPLALDDGQVIDVRVQNKVEIKAPFIISGDVYNTTWYQQQVNSLNKTAISVDTTSEHGIRPVNIYGTVINKHVTIISGIVTISEMVDITVTVTVCTQYGCTDSYQHVTDLTASRATQGPEINIGLISGVIVSIVLILVVSFIIFMVVRKKRQPNQESLTYSGLQIGTGEGRLESTYDGLRTYVNVQHPPGDHGLDNTSSNEPPVSGVANTSGDDPPVSGEVLNNPTSIHLI